MNKENAKISSPILPCTLTIEQLLPSGTTANSTTYKDAKLIVGRNQFREIMLLVNTKKTSFKYSVESMRVHQKFIKDGKSTIIIQDPKVNLMISNAPPNMLMVLIKTLMTKIKVNVDKKQPTTREKLLSGLTASFDEISPLTMTEYKKTVRKQATHPEESPIRAKRPRYDGESPVSSRLNSEDNKTKLPRATKLISPTMYSYEQQKVFKAVRAGINIFFTGSAGTGKSFLIKRLVGILPPEVTFVTASTGIAACAIGGTTLHAFAGMGTGNFSQQKSIESAAKKNAVAQNWRKCKHLIIDEISMIDGEFFTKLEAVARAMRNNDKVFGGIQLILCGDFLQLPPVGNKGQRPRFCFESPAWKSSIDAVVELRKVWRQQDEEFVNILQEIRQGRCSEQSRKMLLQTQKNNLEKDGIEATLLCTHKEDVENINSNKLLALNGATQIYNAIDSDPILHYLLENQTPVPGKLQLKVGAQVILMKNLDVSKGLVNGARGVVVSFRNDAIRSPVVKFVCGSTVPLKNEKWSVKLTGGSVLTRSQIPLKLGWSFSIHKSQGMTLDCVEMSLSKVFEAGQAYVALSRAKSLQGLKVRDFTQKCIRAHPEALKFYQNVMNENQRSNIDLL